MPRLSFFVQKSILKSSAFALFLTSQCISSLGDSFQFIAATTLMVKMTGSGLAAGFSFICMPISSIVFSAFAGSLGDRFQERNLLIFLDLLRAVTSALFIFAKNIPMIYFLTLLLTSLDIFYNPSKRKIISRIIDDSRIMTANSMLTGVSGISYLIGPLAAGFAIDLFGVEIAFIINSVSFLFSSLIISLIRFRDVKTKFRHIKKYSLVNKGNGIVEGFFYLKNKPSVKEMIITLTVVCMGIASMNIAFYPFSFDTLKVTSKGWGVMMSIFYGTNLVATFIQMALDKRIQRNSMLFANLSLICIAFVWFLYGMTSSLLVVLFLIFIEGTAEAVCSIILLSRLQIITEKIYIARMTGLNDLINNTGRLFAMIFTYLFMNFLSSRRIFVVNSAILILFCVFKIIKTKTTKKNKYRHKNAIEI